MSPDSACGGRQDAVDSCPVDCIHWVQKDELAALEWVMQVPPHVCGRRSVHRVEVREGLLEMQKWAACVQHSPQSCDGSMRRAGVLCHISGYVSHGACTAIAALPGRNAARKLVRNGEAWRLVGGGRSTWTPGPTWA